MKIHITPALICFSLLTHQSWADTFTMKDGRIIDGTVIKEDSTSYFVEVQFSPGIKDERVLAKADVTGVKREKPDIAAFEAISGFFPTPDSLSAGEYKRRIQAVEKFLSDHRGSSKSKEAKAMLASLKAEANEILAGAVKLDGIIISPAEYRANAYDIDSRIGAANIKQFIDDSRYLQALRAFARFEPDFRNTQAYDDLVPLIRQVIRVYIAGIEQSLATFDARLEEREIGLERMPLAERTATANAIRNEDSALERRFQDQKSAKIGWVTPHLFFKPSLQETVNFGKRELTRLSAAKRAAHVDAGKAYRDTLSLIQSGGKPADVTSAISAAKTAGVATRYIENLQAAAKSAGLNP